MIFIYGIIAVFLVNLCASFIRDMMQNTPQNSMLQFNFAIHFDIRIADAIVLTANPNSRGWWRPNNLLKLQKDVSIVDFSQKITKFFQSKFEEDEVE